MLGASIGSFGTSWAESSWVLFSHRLTWSVDHGLEKAFNAISHGILVDQTEMWAGPKKAHLEDIEVVADFKHECKCFQILPIERWGLRSDELNDQQLALWVNKPWFVFANFCGVNISTMADYKDGCV